MYPEIPLSEWPADQQRRLALEAAALFEPILRSLGFDPADAQARAKRYLDNLDNRLRELGEGTRRFPARTAFITRYAPKEIASRHFDSQAPGAYYWTWLLGMLCVHWGKNFRLLLDPARRGLSLETAGTQVFQTALDLPPHAVRAIADAWRPDILHGLLERKQECYDDSGNRVGQKRFLSSGNDEWAAVEVSYRLYDAHKPSLCAQDPQDVRRMERIEAERKKIEQLGDRAGCVAWEADWQSAFARAKAEGKPVMADFTGDWCGWCRRLDEITFRDPTVAELSTHTVNVKVDDRKDHDLHARLRVFGIPDVRFYSPDEELIDRSRRWLHKGNVEKHIADYNVLATRLGWLPFYPQFDRNPLDLCREAAGKGAADDDAIVKYAVDKLKSGEMSFAVEDPDDPKNIPRVMFWWRSNQLGACGKGHEYMLKHMLGTHNAVLGPELDVQTSQMQKREAYPGGKFDLVVTPEVRMCSTALYSDVVLPTAGWYEMHDLNTTDLHPFIHPFTPAIDPPWETKVNWDVFAAIAEEFSKLAGEHLGVQKDLVATPLQHYTPGEIGQPFGRVKDWKKGEVEAIPGKTMPALQVITRDYGAVFRKMTALGPVVREKGLHGKGASWTVDDEYEELKDRLGTVTEDGPTKGMPKLTTGKRAAEMILALSPETNGKLAVRAWKSVEEHSGLELAHISKPQEGMRYDFDDVVAQPRRVLTSPTWTGKPSDTRTYAPFIINIENNVPFHTLTGRQHFYLDHELMATFGETLPVFRPPLDMSSSVNVPSVAKNGKEIVLNYLTPHSKWSIHSTFAETPIMQTLFRGGPNVWLNSDDAKSIGVNDNDWIECYNMNGVILARAVVSPRIPQGKAFMYHAQEKTINSPCSAISHQPAGCHNAGTRIVMKPTQMIGGYAQISYGFNYYGTTGSQRDESIVVRKAEKVEWHED